MNIMTSIGCLILMIVTPALADNTLPVSDDTPIIIKPRPVREPTLLPSCRDELQEAFNIGNDVYITGSRYTTYHYNSENETVGEPQSSFRLPFFDKKFHNIKVLIPLTDFCLKSPLCTDSSWNELENLVIVYGRFWKSPYDADPKSPNNTFFLAEQNVDADRKFKLLTEETVSDNLLEKMRKLNLPISEEKDLNEPVSIMLRFFWSSKDEHSYIECLGAVFVPSRAEMLLLATDTPPITSSHVPDVPSYHNLEENPSQLPEPKTQLRNLLLFRRKFNNFNDQWSELRLADLGLKSDLIGLIAIGEDVHAVGRESELFDIVWNDQDEISIKESEKPKLMNCTELPMFNGIEIYEFESPYEEKHKPINVHVVCWPGWGRSNQQDDEDLGDADDVEEDSDEDIPACIAED